MRRWWLLPGLMAAVSAGCDSGTESGLVWESSMAFSEEADADAGPDEKAWILDVMFEPPMPLVTPGTPATASAVLARFPEPMGKSEQLVAASVELVPETPERRLAEIPLSATATYVKRGVRSRTLSRAVFRVRTKRDAPAPPPVIVSVGGFECITRLADEWQAGRFNTEAVDMAYSADCVPALAAPRSSETADAAP